MLRLIQGIGLGGGRGGAVLLAFEYATPERRGLFGSDPQAGITIEMLFSTLFIGLASTLPEQQFLGWGWRAPFGLGAGLVALGLWIRNGIDETPHFKKLRSDGGVEDFPVRELLRNFHKEVVTAVLVKFGETGSFYMLAVFLVSYATILRWLFDPWRATFSLAALWFSKKLIAEVSFRKLRICRCAPCVDR